MSGAVRLDKADGVARLTLTHAGKFNAMSRAMWAQLQTLVRGLETDPSVRCVLLQGSDGHFCAGGDIAEYPSFRFDSERLRQFHEAEVWGALQALLDCECPVLALIDGNCMGAGMELACCADIRLASSTARFGAPIARLGFPMAPRELALVAGVAGQTVARAMLLAAEVFDAPDLLQRGFLTRVFAPDALVGAGADWAQRMVGLAPAAARLNKRSLRGVMANTEAYAYADSAEHREGIGAFVAKRKPVF